MSNKRMNLQGTLEIGLNFYVCTFVLLYNKLYSLKRNCHEELHINRVIYFFIYL